MSESLRITASVFKRVFRPNAWEKTYVVLPLRGHQIAFLMSGRWSSS